MNAITMMANKFLSSSIGDETLYPKISDRIITMPLMNFIGMMNPTLRIDELTIISKTTYNKIIESVIMRCNESNQENSMQHIVFVRRSKAPIDIANLLFIVNLFILRYSRWKHWCKFRNVPQFYPIWHSLFPTQGGSIYDTA